MIICGYDQVEIYIWSSGNIMWLIVIIFLWILINMYDAYNIHLWELWVKERNISIIGPYLIICPHKVGAWSTTIYIFRFICITIIILELVFYLGRNGHLISILGNMLFQFRNRQRFPKIQNIFVSRKLSNTCTIFRRKLSCKISSFFYIVNWYIYMSIILQNYDLVFE